MMSSACNSDEPRSVYYVNDEGTCLLASELLSRELQTYIFLSVDCVQKDTFTRFQYADIEGVPAPTVLSALIDDFGLETHMAVTCPRCAHDMPLGRKSVQHITDCLKMVCRLCKKTVEAYNFPELPLSACNCPLSRYPRKLDAVETGSIPIKQPEARSWELDRKKMCKDRVKRDFRELMQVRDSFMQTSLDCLLGRLLRNHNLQLEENRF